MNATDIHLHILKGKAGCTHKLVLKQIDPERVRFIHEGVHKACSTPTEAIEWIRGLHERQDH